MRVSLRIQWCMGHRVVGNTSMCAHLHGHTYSALLESEAESGELDGAGRVVNSSILKQRVGGWVEEHWDHGFLLAADDAPGNRALRAFEASIGWQSKRFLLPANPTAENIADYMLRVVGPDVLQGSGARLVRVTVWETENYGSVAEL